tara:strand:- start:1903 stop:2079 length:177 start_codon:yes stop_codon:yes gene_type:complete
MQERLCSFCGGGILNIIIMPYDQMLEIIAIGFLGGLSGIVARELYTGVKSLIIKYFKK